MKEIYMDNAATTRTSERVIKVANTVLENTYYNPSSIYDGAQQTKAEIENVRKEVAASLKADAKEIYFTSGGTESDNWAIKGVAAKMKSGHIITSAIEHHAVLHTCEYLEKQGFSVSYIPVDEKGLVSVEDIKKEIRQDTILISVMYANNEIGTIQPISEIGQLAREKGILFHTDAVQAYGKLDIDVQEENIDMLSLSAHKLHGLKGTGALYIRKGIKLDNLIHGGAQEKKKRAGTENVLGILALGEALRESYEERERKNQVVTGWRNHLIETVLATVPHSRLNGDLTNRLPGNVNISFRFIEGESLLMLLEKQGIMASSGSACTSGSLDPSHVLLAIGLPHEIAHGSLRISLDYMENNEEQIEHLIKVLPGIVERLRDLSPLYEDYLKEEN
ncbi:cysteine desulfurase NifS [Clostridia bacterium]|nr:cysteine desulfurase NifS [Clostridia bacterium]